MRFTKKIIPIIVLSVVLAVGYLYSQNNWIQVEEFSINISDLPPALAGLKIAHLSDLHLPRNASSISNIVEITAQQCPDLIVITGDIIDRSAKIESCGLDKLAAGLAAVAPTYAVTGNHEYWRGDVSLWQEILEHNGVKVLINEAVQYTKDESGLVIIGVQDNCPLNMDELQPALKADNPILLLSHRPDAEIWQEKLLCPQVVLAGHAHGGQFRIPFIGGVIAPDQGLFPKVTSGLYLYDGEDAAAAMIVSRGLGNSVFPFRINNRPHLPVITLYPPEGDGSFY